MKFKIETHLLESALYMFILIVAILLVGAYMFFMTELTKDFGFIGGATITIMPLLILIFIAMGIEIKKC